VQSVCKTGDTAGLGVSALELEPEECHISPQCLTKRAVGERAVGKQARKYTLIFFYVNPAVSFVLSSSVLLYLH
jgi:hypothetical protein